MRWIVLFPENRSSCSTAWINWRLYFSVVYKHLTDSKNKTQAYLKAGAARNTFHLKLAAISTIIIITEAKDRKINTNSQQNVNLRRKTLWISSENWIQLQYLTSCEQFSYLQYSNKSVAAFNSEAWKNTHIFFVILKWPFTKKCINIDNKLQDHRFKFKRISIIKVRGHNISCLVLLLWQNTKNTTPSRQKIF